MVETKYKGFIINKVNYKDNDAIFNVVTADNTITFKAKGINKITSKNASSCNYFMVSEFIVSSKTETSIKTLKSSNLIKMYKKPYEDILVSSSYLFICSILNQLSEHINGYNVAIECFDMLENEVYPIDVLNYFLKILINTLGYQPNLKGCINCNTTNNLISFDFESGGFICKNCFNSTMHEKYTAGFLKDLYNFLKSDEVVGYDNIRSLQIFKMYVSFLKNVVNINVESSEFIYKCL